MVVSWRCTGICLVCFSGLVYWERVFWCVCCACLVGGVCGAGVIRSNVLHQTGPNNPVGLNKNTDKIPFHPYFTVRDILGFAFTIVALTVLRAKVWREREKTTNTMQQSDICYQLLSHYVSGIIMPIFRRTKTVCYCYQPHPAEPEQHTKCSNTRYLFSWRWA
jgi:hypothetical protein